ncbi:3-phosphoshikimate 1-carboxyvinyltransferase [Thermosyntropha lipolytica DSM 11003]|uniref:3-phosphoshikimate 1-carboxyvinyltransferase n=1 Tax=Thermosyntropha lipolytica DSM 11003 TaxID=1123382 RepID=A0A1M5QA59_9FIRM|nr:3-phosphoshikimate 1-carboxyvinyltransferase [Thermosyntropha lipolytica]SHH10776.1 3-phosphoshikimate 1-carboxyvinyltransferase [Thermosyntropha lipolytica DSM 11003]
MLKRIIKSRGLKGEIKVASDKSISHRAAIFSALARGESVIHNYLEAADTISTLNCLRLLGAKIEHNSAEVRIKGEGLHGLKEPDTVLDCGNSGTTMRLLTGLCASYPFFTVLSGDHSLNRRPMKRVILPLTLMGAEIEGRANGNYPPLAVKGKRLKGIKYDLPVASAQVKSALLLAGLDAEGETVISEPVKSRDHTERMLQAMGADLKVDGLTITLQPGKELGPQEFLVPGDISSAAFFMVAAALVPHSEILIKEVGINPTRAGIIEVLEKMGACIKLENRRTVGGEPIADIAVKSSELKGISIEGEIVPRLIDEIPVLAVAMAAAQGTSVVRGAEELRVKETDRIRAIVSELGRMGVSIVELEDGFIIEGDREKIKGAEVKSFGDHRIAMSLAVMGLIAEGETVIEGTEAVNISFPGFWDIMTRLAG